MDLLPAPEAARLRRGDGDRSEKLSVATGELVGGRGAGLGSAATAAAMGSVSRRSSVMTVPSLNEGGAHRLDLLIEEQVTRLAECQWLL